MDFEYIYCCDVGRAVDLAATIPMPDQTIMNIGTGQITPFEELVTIAQEILPKLKVKIIPGQSPAVSSKQPLEISRAEKYLEWKPTYDMRSGLCEYIKDLEVAMQPNK